MTALIVCTSKSNGSTRAVADEMAKAIDARVVSPDEVTDAEIDAAELVGWGSGIYWMSFASEVTDRIKALADRPRGRAFVVATSGLPETPLRRYTRSMSDLLAEKGFEVADTFHCRGLDTMGPLGLVGGVNRGHPTQADLALARTFALRVAG
ncbi:flavodoxin [Gordonia zhaorongruii]|uniref:flavodoxin n=1 Tax=Gordonia zhaorongruii TaxID=2597659 RepID=UPI001052156B|nr:flavodoxin [Gordonia zhaorongruii]